MKIGLDGNRQIHNRETVQSGSSLFQKKVNKASTILDITGIDKDVSAYQVQGRTWDDISREAEAIDVKTASDYMTVMSNTMSEEDYKKACEDGFDPSEMDMEESANILDHIKTVMAQSGQIVAGYNDDLSGVDLEDITGNKVSAESLKKTMEAADLPATEDNLSQVEEAVRLIENIDAMPEGSIEYMLEHRLDPTIENVYTARYSAVGDGGRHATGFYRDNGSAYLGKAGVREDIEELRPQLTKAVEEMELVDITQEKANSAALWLLDKGLPVDKENILRYEEINSINWPVPANQIAHAAIRSIGEGKRAKEGNLSQNYSTAYEDAKNLLNSIKNTRSMQETRLQMTLEAAVTMVKAGVDINTSNLTDLVEELKQKEQQLLHAYFGEGTIEELEEKADIYGETIEAVDYLPKMPAQTIGVVIREAGETTLQSVSELGRSQEAILKEANRSYETMMTAPRRDMGDSYAKAFANIDAILEDLGEDLNDENRKAVRILGYNSMELNEENIEKVRSLDRQVMEVINKLTPAKTLELIRQGVNPLKLSMEELIGKIRETETDSLKDNERFSRFLYKLEQSGSITQEERDSYIGIYRLLNRLEKTDYASIGQMLEQGGEVTFGKLLTSMRSRKVDVNVRIDDNFGFLSDKVEKGISITAQIEAALSDRLGSENKELEDKILQDRYKEYKEILETADKEVINNLQADAIPVTANHIEAMLQFNRTPGSFFKDICDMYRKVHEETDADDEESKLLDAFDLFKETLTDKESAAEGYEKLAEAMESTLLASEEETDAYVDIKTIALMHKQLGLSIAQAKEENYHIPVLMGDSITDINLKLIHGKEQGLINISMDTEVFGSVNGEIRIANNKASVFMVGADDNKQGELSQVALTFAGLLESEGYSQVEVNTVKGRIHAYNKYSEENADITREETAKLYKVAKIFIETIQSAV